MEDTSSTFENYIIKKNNIEYNICLKYSSFSIELKSSLKDPIKHLQSSTYLKTYTLEELKKISMFFSLFSNISDIIPNVKSMLSNENSRDLEIGEKIVKLILTPPVQNIDKITFVLSKKEISKDEIIQELIKSNCDLKKRVEYLEKEIYKIKEILENKQINGNKDNVIKIKLILI